MDSETMATFFALVLLGGAGGTIVALVHPPTRAQVADVALPVAGLVAVGATAGSLYFSEVADFVPCELCWFQRIAMYPLALILPLAVVRRQPVIALYGLSLAVVGIAISTYHAQLQLFPEQSSFCALDNPCSASWVEAFGWMTIPQMAGLSFALIIAMTSLTLLSSPQESP